MNKEAGIFCLSGDLESREFLGAIDSNSLKSLDSRLRGNDSLLKQDYLIKSKFFAGNFDCQEEIITA